MATAKTRRPAATVAEPTLDSITSDAVDRSISNADLAALPEVQEALNNDHIIVFDMVPSSKNENFVSVYFCGKVNVASSNGTKLSRYAMKRLKFDVRLERAIQTMHVDEVAELGIEKGWIDEEAMIRIIDSVEPAFDGHKARLTKEGEELVDATSGEDVYRTTEVVFKDEFEELGGHETIKVVTLAEFEETEEGENTSQSNSRISSEDVVE